ncbi:MAG: EFR1 family ferrodoxin [Candidatus Hydrothermia bacterium]
MRKRKIQILYYTGAGNTQLLSSYLKERFQKDGHEAVLFKITKDSPLPEIDKFDLNVLASPVYAYHAPFTVREFLSRLPEGKGIFYLIFTKGLILGNAAFEVYQLLKAKGYRVSGFSDIVLADTLFLLTAPRKSLLELFYLLPNRFHRFKLSMIYKSLIKAVHLKKPVKIRRKFYAFITEFIAKNFWKRVEKWKKALYADENCNLCGVCVKVCPRGNIEIRDGKVIFHENCEFCTACIHRCPREAIQLNGFTKNKARFKIGRESRYFLKGLWEE